MAQMLMIAGTVVSTLGQIQAGNAARKSANFQAAQMNQQAGQERATGQRAAIEQRRTARLASSRATALAAASGGGATDPTILNILGDIHTEGEYNALSALFGGEERARGLEMGAAAKVVEGKSAKQASIISAGSTLSTGIGESLMMKYGGTYKKGSIF